MGLEAFKDKREKEAEREDSSDDTSEQPDHPTTEAIGSRIKDRLLTGDFDAEVDGDTITADKDDLGMVFALMTMDYEEADIQDLQE